MIKSNWFKTWKAKFGLPENYFVFDFETTGLKLDTDLILQIGYCHVENKQVVANEAFVLDWTSCSDVDQNWLIDRIKSTKKYIETDRVTNQPTGRKYQFSITRLQEEGLPPKIVLAAFQDMIISYATSNVALTGYNIWKFDTKMWESHSKKFLGAEYKFNPASLLDLGLMEKASQLNLTPKPTETIEEFYRRAANAFGKNVGWSLERDIIPKYRLDKRYGLDVSKAHNADFDCQATHCLMETYRGITNTPEPYTRMYT